MADFVAVIRRAVDGLANNTPDMRAKVYDKARGAVRRQLENMKPTPSEDMILRQMGKLEAAIESVEAEHAEALPADEPSAAPIPLAPDVVDEQEPVPEQPPFAEAEPEAPVASATEWRQDDEVPTTRSEDTEGPAGEAVESQVDHGEPVHEYDQSVADTHAAKPLAAQVDDYGAPSEEPHRFAEAPEEPWAQETEARTQHDHYPDFGGEAAEVSEPPHVETEIQPAAWPAEEDAYPAHEEPRADHEPLETVSPEPSVDENRGWHPEEVQPAAPAAADEWIWPPEEPRKDATPAWDQAESFETSAEPADASPEHQRLIEPVEAHFGEETHVSADSVRMPSVADFPALGQAEHAGLGRPEDEAAYASPVATDQPPGKDESDPWSDLEELIGYNKDALPAAGAAAIGAEADEDMVPPPPRTYRVAPKKRSYTGPILALIGLLIVAAGGYALWINRDAITDVAGLSGTSAPAVAPTATTEEPAAEPPETAQEAAPPEGEAAETDTAPAAPEDGVAADAKFTQRLLPDGTEVDEGPAAAGATGEGQSVAQLNAPPATPAEAGAAAEAPAEPSATPTDAAALAGEKMFLYEERLGQTAPTAIEGAVSWTLQQEAGQNGRQEPVVQGRINIPGRGLTALLTFKRNTDPSLPASHLVEIVFAVPPGFEGGAIDSVQRIAMKQTEQDRGDALIAVPAKITDDFHMIALNDFPDARATNIELLRTRNWIDIPLAYRNGRRALLTMQKGEAGTQAFNEAIREWSALSGSTTPAPAPAPAGQ